jgi:hypothetical protein
MPRIRLALAAAGLAIAATTVGATAISAPANAGVLGCVGSAVVLEHDLRVDAGHAAGSDLAHVTALVGALAFDVVTLDVTDIQGQAEYVITHAANGTLAVSAKTLADAQAVLASCQVS